MRPLAVTFFLCLLACRGAWGQEQERKLVDRVLKPDLELGNAMQNKAYYSGSGKGSVDTTSRADVKEFYYTQHFQAKKAETREFNAKTFWQGQFQFETKNAQTKTSSAVGKVYDTKELPVKGANEASKEYGVRQYGTREASTVGKTSQAKLNEQYLGRGVMSMDQVRDLLNKNK